MPLGSTRARGHSAMINLIGELPARDALLEVPGLHWHDYGKSVRPGRKLGHITLVESSARQRDLHSSKVLSRVDRATWLAIR
jgi:5-(carboxyamino)imidazole ribonucleotide synthase